MYTQRFIYQGLVGRPSCHAATIAELPSGQYLCAFYAGTDEGAADVAILTSRLSDEVDGWQEPRVVIDSPGKSDGNPVLHVDGYGHVWLFYVTQQQPGWDNVLMYAVKSEDEGRTWERPSLLSETVGWMTRTKPLRLAPGRTILPCYDEVKWRGFCLVSDDECRHWEPSATMESPVSTIQPTLVARDDGSLLALLRSAPPASRADERRIWRSESRDGGMTWSPCEPTDLPNPNSGIDAVRLDSGEVVLLYNDTAEGRTPLSLAMSLDGGATWKLRWHLETEPGEFSYPAVIQGHGGRLHAVYTWKRTHIKHVMCTRNWLTGPR